MAYKVSGTEQDGSEADPEILARQQAAMLKARENAAAGLAETKTTQYLQRIKMGPLSKEDVERCADTVAREYLEDPDGPNTYSMRMFAISYALTGNLHQALLNVPRMNGSMPGKKFNSGGRCTTARKWLQRPDISAFIAKIRRTEIAKVVVTAEQLKGTLANLANTNNARCFEMVPDTEKKPVLNPDGSPVLDEDGTALEEDVPTGKFHMELKPDMTYLDQATIKRVQITKYERTRRDGTVETTYNTNVELHDAAQASRVLMECMGMLKIQAPETNRPVNIIMLTSEGLKPIESTVIEKAQAMLEGAERAQLDGDDSAA